MQKIWKQKNQYTSQILQEYSKEFGFMHSIYLPLLLNRGIKTKEQLQSYFHSDKSQTYDPFLMLGMDKAVERIATAIDQQQKVMIYGDYDVDGTTSVATVYRFLEPYLKNIIYYLPDRHKEGYGISEQSIDFAQSEGVSLIIALDCGIRSVELVAKAKQQGIDYIICDHHLPGDTIPEAVAVLDPKQHNCKYPFKELSGCGIGFKLCQALAQSIDDINTDPYVLVDYVAISIVSDLVELRDENRILVKLGLEKLKQNPSLGLRMVMEQAIEKEWVDVEEILFMIGPRINAAGRLASARSAVDLLLAKNNNEAMKFSELLSQLNSERRTKDTNITDEALEMIQEDATFQSRKSTVVFHKSWHKGVIGIVASRLQDHYYRPTIVLTESEGKVTGSARSIANFDIHEALKKCSEHLIQFGGHKYAAGMTLLPEQVSSFSEAFDEVAQEQLKDDDLVPKLDYDLELDWRQINTKLYQKIKQFGPFGPGNMQAVFVARGLVDSGYARTLGADYKHLKINLWDSSTGNSISAIGFNLGQHYPHISQGGRFDMAFTIEENRFNGQTQLQLNIKDIHCLQE